MSRETLRKAEARALILNSQGLASGSISADGPDAVVQILQRLSYVQIDTISVVERAHHHTLWSRHDKYRSHDLEKALAARQIFEYWAHAASYLPISDFRYCLPRMQAYASGQWHWFRSNKKLMNHVLERIRAEGPLRSADFQRTDGKRGGSWFEWKPTKKALENLFMAGELMVLSRAGFQKVYGLREQFLSADVDTSMPTMREFAKYLVLSTLKAQGVATAKQIGYLRKMETRREVAQAIAELEEDRLIVKTKIEHLKEDYFYLSDTPLPKLNTKELHILSPFDNLVIQRQRLKDLFGFDYLIECYLPAAKRKHGYFTLPVLYGDQFIGRLDCKAHRAEKRFEVKTFSVEDGTNISAKIRSELDRKLKKFAAFNGCANAEMPDADKAAGHDGP